MKFKSISFYFSELPQPFVWANSTAAFSKIQNQVCGPMAMTFDRYNSRDELYAFRRLVNDHNLRIWMPIKKKESFSFSPFYSCKRIRRANLPSVMEWTVGNSNFTMDFFSDEIFTITSCSNWCFVIKMSDGKIYLSDYDCDKNDVWVVCRNSSGNFHSNL